MRILWLKTELLHPVDKGGKIRTYEMLRALKSQHPVTYLTLDDGSGGPDAARLAPEYCDALERVPHSTAAKGSLRFYGELAGNLLSPLPYAIAKYRSPAMTDAIVRQVCHGAFDVVVCDFLAPAVNLPASIPCPLVLFQHNVEAVIWRRHYEVRSNPVSRAYFRLQWQRMRRFEGAMCRRVDGVVTVSPEDSQAIREDYGAGFVEDVPTGINVEYFKPRGSIARERNHLVFTGSMDWMPNDDAMRFFVGEVLPRIRRDVPDVRLTIVGRAPAAWLRELAGRDAAITVTGRVDDVRPYIERASAYVVPIRVGGGTRLKIYEGLAMECPMVSTTVGAEGLPLVDGEDILLADDPPAFAAAVVKVLRDQELARRLAVTAAGRVRRDYGWSAVAAKFARLCAEIAGRTGRVRPN